MDVLLEEVLGAFFELDCGNTPEPYAKAYLMGALNCHKTCRKASLNSSLIIICWLTPKLVCGSSENCEILRLGFSSQSAGTDFVMLESLDDDDGDTWLELAVLAIEGESFGAFSLIRSFAGSFSVA